LAWEGLFQSILPHFCSQWRTTTEKARTSFFSLRIVA
jgi:hypothetical protein